MAGADTGGRGGLLERVCEKRSSCYSFGFPEVEYRGLQRSGGTGTGGRGSGMGVCCGTLLGIFEMLLDPVEKIWRVVPGFLSRHLFLAHSDCGIAARRFGRDRNVPFG